MGELGILNVGAGDNKLVFDPSDPAGMIRAARIVKDMIRRGYALLIEIDKDTEGRPIYQRARDFDESKYEYIIADFDPVEAADHDEAKHDEQDRKTESARGAEAEETSASQPARKNGGRRKASSRSVPAAGARGIAVGRTAGG